MLGVAVAFAIDMEATSPCTDMEQQHVYDNVALI
jgi:hypothetical protein